MTMSNSATPYRLPFGWLTAIGFLVLITGWLLPLNTYTSAKGFLQGTIPDDPCVNKTILFVGASRPLPVRDQPLAAYLSTLGHTVLVRTAREVRATDASGMDLVLISESSESVDVKNKLRDVAVPLITWEGWLFDDLQMTGPTEEQAYGELTSETSIRIINPTHPLAAGLSGEVHTALVNNQTSNKFHWGVPSQSAIIVATTLANGNRAHIFAYEQGAQMVGLIAPARRVGLHNATGTNLTTEGLAIFDAAVKWAINCTPAATPTPPLPGTGTPTNTSTPTPTGTLVAPPPATATSTPTPTPTATFIPGTTPTPTATFIPGTTPTPTPTATLAPGSAQLTVSNTDFLFTDADSDDHISAGDTLLYAISIQNTGDSAALQVRLEDEPDPNTTLITGSVRTNKGSVTEGNAPGDKRVVIIIDRLESGASATMSLQVTINQPISVAELHNQARITFIQSENPGGQATVMSDDPDTPALSDATLTEIDANLMQRAKLFLPLVQNIGNR
jgi:uncharacterized repeat protein (TIGR01451 family)